MQFFAVSQIAIPLPGVSDRQTCFLFLLGGVSIFNDLEKRREKYFFNSYERKTETSLSIKPEIIFRKSLVLFLEKVLAKKKTK